MRRPRVLGLGDNIVDRFVDRGVEYPGGNAVNVAVVARSLGATTAYLGVIGDDERGDFLLRCVRQEGVDVSRVVVRDGPTGLTGIEAVRGDRSFLEWNGGGVTVSAPLRLGSRDLAYVAGFDLVHSGVYSAVEPEWPRLEQSGVLRSFDLSSEPEFRERDYLERVGPWTDLALVSLAELPDAAVRPALERIAASGPGLVLGTRGGAGLVLLAGGAVLTQAAAPVPGPFVDTMACGDACLAGFVVSLLRAGWRRGTTPSTRQLRAALVAAAEVAARQCTMEAAFGHGRRILSRQRE